MTWLAIDDLQYWFCLIYPDDEHRRRISTTSPGWCYGLLVASLGRLVCSQDLFMGRRVVWVVLPADDVLGARDWMLADSPAALDVAVVAAIDRNQPADDRDLAQVGAEPRPEAVPGPRQVVGPHHMKDPVPHKAALL